MAENKIQEAAGNLTQTFRESGQTIVNSAVAAQERNMRYFQNTLENGIEVLKRNVEDTRSLLGELTEQPQKVGRAYQSISDSAIAAQDRNVKFVQNTFENGMEVFKGHAESTRALTEELTKQSQNQLAALQTLAHESLDAYLGYLSAPFTYYKQALEATEEAASWGMERAQHVAQQGAEAAQKTARQAQKAAEPVTK
jgi:hypothetical protein